MDENAIIKNLVYFSLVLIIMFILYPYLKKENCDKECYDAKIKYEQSQAEIKEKELLNIQNHELEKQKIELEKLQIQAEIEKNKPIEVKIQENNIKNEQSINKQLEENNDSLNYLENSQKVRDIIE